MKLILPGTRLVMAVVAVAATVGLGIAQEADKNITHVLATNPADGRSEVRKEILEECILSLPNASGLEASVEPESYFLKGINGDETKNAHTKTYLASIEINYILYQKELIIVTTNSMEGQAPVFKEVERKLKQTKSFISNPNEGDLFAGRSERAYYFSSESGAVKDVKKRASIWLKQQSGGVCRNK